jgi:elongation factor P
VLSQQVKKMPKASDLKKGSVVEIDGEVYFTRQIEKRNPSARGASTLFKVRFFNVRSGQKLEQTLKGDDFVKDGDLVRRSVQFSYREGDVTTFMDSENYDQYILDAEAIEEQSCYMTEDLEGMIALLVDGQIVGIEIPQTVELEITETAPGLKAASASARTKPAVLSTGLEIQVPEYLESGERIKVNTTNGKFVSRA